jgi:membrane protease YdiL (CAAX protease family)
MNVYKAYLTIVMLLTTMSIYAIYHFQFDRSLYRYTVIIPGILALLFLLFPKLSDIQYPEFLKQFKVSINSYRWLLLALIFYVLLSYLSSGISALVFNGNFVIVPEFRVPLSKVWLIFVLAFFEEIGWRGFALPQLLKKFSFFQSSLIIGVIWALWHFPGYLVGFGAPSDIPFSVFFLWVIASSFIFTCLYVKSNGNIWTAILLHFGANMALQLYPIMPSPADTKSTFYILTLLVVVIAAFFTFNHKEM